MNQDGSGDDSQASATMVLLQQQMSAYRKQRQRVGHHLGVDTPAVRAMHVDQGFVRRRPGRIHILLGEKSNGSVSIPAKVDVKSRPSGESSTSQRRFLHAWPSHVLFLALETCCSDN